jgi:hypothetical protein
MKPVGASQIAVRPTPGAAPEQSRDARARAWAYAFDCYRMKKGSHPEPLTPRKAVADVFRLVLDSASNRGHLPDKGSSDDANLRNTEGVSHVDQQPN